MSQILNKNKNRIAKYLTDSEFALHSFEEIKNLIEGYVTVISFDVSLSKDGWENKEQIVENDKFFAEGYSYTIEPKTVEDDIQWNGAGVKASSIADGEMTFVYDDPAPTQNISLVVTAQKAKIESSEVVYVFNSFINELTVDTSVTPNVYTPDSPISSAEITESMQNGVPVFLIDTFESGEMGLVTIQSNRVWSSIDEHSMENHIIRVSPQNFVIDGTSNDTIYGEDR